MKWFSSVFLIAIQNLRKWQTSPRIWVIGIVLTILIHSYWEDVAEVGAYLGEKPSLWVFPFLYSQYYMKLIFTLPLVLLFCDTPFLDANQIFILVRSGRVRWLWGQIIYIGIANLLYYLFIFLMTIVIGCFYADIGLEWGKVFYTISETSIAPHIGVHFVEMQYNTLHYFTPILAVWFTFLMSWLIGTMIGLLMLALSLCTHHRSICLIFPAILILFSCFVVNVQESWVFYSPASWNTLNYIDVGGTTIYPSFSYCILVLLTMIIICTIASLLTGRKKALGDSLP